MTDPYSLLSINPFKFYTIKRWFFTSLLFCFFFVNCKGDVFPKPKAMLRLDYPNGIKKAVETEAYKFSYNTQAKLKLDKGNSVTLEYPNMKGAIFITYKKVDNNIEKLLSDAKKLSYKHARKAYGINEKIFVNKDNRVYGILYEVEGNVASQAQFYITDSLRHFVRGSLYFSARPNYDSIFPAVVYLQKDIRKIMETIQWK